MDEAKKTEPDNDDIVSQEIKKTLVNTAKAFMGEVCKSLDRIVNNPVEKRED